MNSTISLQPPLAPRHRLSGVADRGPAGAGAAADGPDPWFAAVARRELLAASTDAAARRQVLEARIAHRAAEHLHIATLALPADVAERLRFAREQAVAAGRRGRTGAGRARPAGAAVGASGVFASLGRLLRPAGGLGAGLRVATLALPAVLLVGGLVGIERHVLETQIRAAAEVDAGLLSDDTLPQAAYHDAGFRAYMQPPVR